MMAKKPDTAEQLAKAAEAAKARRDAMNAAAYGPETITPPAPAAAPKSPVAAVDGEPDGAAPVVAREDDGAPARPQRQRDPRPKAKSQPSREATKAITYHAPPAVRQQLKALSVERDRTMQDVIAEALNLVFRKYDKPTIAPRDK